MHLTYTTEVIVSETDDDIFEQFKEFLQAKRDADQQETADSDYEIEIFDEKGRGARLKRSHAKPFLQSLGIDLDPEPPADTDTEGKSKRNPPKARPTNAGNTPTVARKYFAKKVTPQ